MSDAVQPQPSQGDDTNVQLQRNHNLEGLKLISDWSKWLVTIETAAIAAVGALLMPKEVASASASPHDSSLFTVTVALFGSAAAVTAVVCFVVSIIWATLLLLSVPTVTRELPTHPPSADFWEMQDSVIKRPLTLLSYWQYRFFFAGVILFALFVTCRAIGAIVL